MSIMSKNFFLNKISEPYQPFTRLMIFSFLWGTANIFHLMSFSRWENPLHMLFWCGALLSATVVIIRPQSIGWFFGLVLCSIGKNIIWLPAIPNHMFFEIYINLAILLAIIYYYFKNRTTDSPFDGRNSEVSENIYNFFAPIARISLIILYFYCVLHKLNVDYFDFSVSCSTHMLHELHETVGFFPDVYFTKVLAVWGTVLAGAAIPLLLLFHRTRLVGIILGLFFHYLLSLHPAAGIYSFSAELLPLFFIFTPLSFTTHFNEVLKNAREYMVQNLTKVLVLIGTLVAVVAGLSINTLLQGENIQHMGNIWWFFWGAGIIIIFLVTLKKGSLVSRLENPFRLTSPVLILIPILVFFNGMSPYLGFKTKTSFSMFSNLKTEGSKTNHLFIPQTFDLVGHQKDLIEVIDTDDTFFDRYLREPKLHTYFEFKRDVSSRKDDFYISYLRNGQPHRYELKNGIGSDLYLQTPHSLILAKMVHFRPIFSDKCQCQH